jgi:hypothetical protein
MSSPLSLEGIEKIFQILQSNQNKINILSNDLSNEGNNIKTKTIQFLNGLEIDIKNILSLLDRIKNDFQKSNQNVDDYKTYCINNDKNQFQDIIVCGCCECCKCGNGCNYSTDNCSYSQPNNISDINKNQVDNRNINEDNNNKFNDNNRYINIKTFNEDNKELPILNDQSSSQFKKNNYTYPNLNLNNDSNDYNNSNYNPLINQNLNSGINKDKNINFNIPQSSPTFNNNRYDDDLQKQLAFIKENLFLNEDINLPIKDKIKSSAVIKSKRFHPSRSFDNFDMNPYPPRKKAIIKYSNKNKNNNNILVNRNNDNDFNNNMFNDNMNNNLFNNLNKNNYDNLSDNNYFNDNQNDMNIVFNNNKNYIQNNVNLNNLKEKMGKMNRVQNFLDKLYNQSGEVVKRFKKIYGDDIEERILNGEINDENLNEMDNILDKIIKMSIWGKEDDENIKEKRRDKSNSYEKKDRKRRHKFVYNALEEKMKLIKAVNNKQAYFKEYPRGWYSTKEYFINNGTEINNDIINKYA